MKKVGFILGCALCLSVCFTGCKAETDADCLVVSGFLDQLNEIAAAGGDDCGKVSADLLSYLKENEAKVKASMKVAVDAGRFTVGGRALKKSLDAAMAEDGALKKAMDTCDGSTMLSFTMGFMGVLSVQ